ncbi:hypothetical protein B0T24DRAFT_246040 [Lasiosphaeria ovina]|uniref:Uncharacterized protein n=1 Tax=Lasiosphaeria ovina TaxID=92902 RepID=A0AAE0K9X5_9PEZI|nr:hypothetical protein B0T24DRAFT_246040 [Lasiosphaeria ovina]
MASGRPIFSPLGLQETLTQPNQQGWTNREVRQSSRQQISTYLLPSLLSCSCRKASVVPAITIQQSLTDTLFPCDRFPGPGSRPPRHSLLTAIHSLICSIGHTLIYLLAIHIPTTNHYLGPVVKLGFSLFFSWTLLSLGLRLDIQQKLSLSRLRLSTVVAVPILGTWLPPNQVVPVFSFSAATAGAFCSRRSSLPSPTDPKPAASGRASSYCRGNQRSCPVSS